MAAYGWGWACKLCNAELGCLKQSEIYTWAETVEISGGWLGTSEAVWVSEEVANIAYYCS